jgi:hypothetical protein
VTTPPPFVIPANAGTQGGNHKRRPASHARQNDERLKHACASARGFSVSTQSRRGSGAEPHSHPNNPSPLTLRTIWVIWPTLPYHRTHTRRTPVHGRLPCPHRQRGRRGTHKARAVIPPHRRCTLAPDAADRMRRAFCSPLPPRQEMATALPGGEIRGRPSARHDAAARQAGFPSCEPFPACRPVAGRGHPRRACPMGQDPARRAEPERRGTAQVRPLARCPGYPCQAPNRRPPRARPLTPRRPRGYLPRPRSGLAAG